MERDIEKRILELFDSKSEKVKRQILEFESKHKFSPRVTRSIIHLSKGSIDELIKVIKAANDDWRDVVVEAESFDFEFNSPFDSNVSK